MIGAGGWLAEQQAVQQRRFLHLLAGSVVAHVVFAALLALIPSSSLPLYPDVLRVDLVAFPSPPGSKPAPPPRPVRKAPPKARQIVLPKQAPNAIPRKLAPPAPPKRPEPVDYEDALAQLREELGEAVPPPPAPSAPESTAGEATPQGSAPSGQAVGIVDPEVAAWHRSVSRHLRGCWITPPEFLNRGLVTGVQVALTSGGTLVGSPRVTNPSGDPYFDDNAVRAVLSCAPLPPPPQPGVSRFAFTSEER
jgi:outer membrane biosynthesis protein TonB